MIVDHAREAAHVGDLLRLAQDEQTPVRQAREVGAALADYFMRAGDVRNAPLDEFTEQAYLGFDARVTEVQVRAGLQRP